MSGADRRDEMRAHLESTRAQFEATNAKIEARAGRNLFFAIASGLVFGAVFLVSLFFFKQLFVLLTAIVVSIVLVELASAFRVAGWRVPRVGAVVAGLVIVAGAYFWGAEGMLVGLFVGSALLTVWRLIEGLVPRWEVPSRNLVSDIFAGLFSLVYVAFLASSAVLLVAADNGEWWVLALIGTVVSVDIGAYAAGVTLGKHKMSPRISPNKTWEGFAGAAVAAIATGVAISIFALAQPWWVGVILGVVVLFTATGGDLTESLIKRNLGVKDMSSWMPGHGGFLDRLDSIFPSAIGVYGVALILGAI